MKFFNKLNYTLANEDTTMEYNILPTGMDHVLSVAGSGARVLPLIAKNPKLLTCIDLVPEQLFIAELRIEAVRSLTHSEYLNFWGYPPANISNAERKDLFHKIDLPPDAKSFFTNLFENHNWESILYLGKWEQTFNTFSKVVRAIMGKSVDKLFQQKTLEDQKRYLQSKFPLSRWKCCLFILGNKKVFNALLYKGNFVEKNIPESYFQFYLQTFNRVFNISPVRENYFTNLLFYGQIKFPEGNPIECNKKVFEEIKKSLETTKVKFLRSDLISATKNATSKIDFVSLSDVPSYFKGEIEKNYLQDMKDGLKKGAILVQRHYLHITKSAKRENYVDITSNFQKEINSEKIQAYIPEILKYDGK